VTEIEPDGPEALIAVATHPEAPAELLTNNGKGMEVGAGVEKPPAESNCPGFFFFLPFLLFLPFFGMGQLGEVACTV
jgi:hypothetical protein